MTTDSPARRPMTAPTRDDGLREALDAHVRLNRYAPVGNQCICGYDPQSVDAREGTFEDHREAAVRAALLDRAERAEAVVAAAKAALTSEDEIAHGEAVWRGQGMGVCAYCEDEWPCRTQRGIDRLRAALPAPPPPAEGKP